MIPSATGHHFAILAILCTLAIFLFPVVSGPYPVTHGPATDFETVQASQFIMLVLALVALAMATCVVCYVALTAFGSIEFHRRLHQVLTTSEASVLRC